MRCILARRFSSDRRALTRPAPPFVEHSWLRLSDDLLTLRRHSWVNPHAWRHARVSWGIVRGEDQAKLSIGIWGRPVSNQLNRYAHFNGLDAKVAEPKDLELPNVPALPVPPVIKASVSVSKALREEIRSQLMAEIRDELKSQIAQYAKDQGGILTDKSEDTDALQKLVDGKARFVVSVTDKKDESR